MASANKFYFTSQDLLDSIKMRGNMPDTHSMITDDEILRLANEEMSTTLLPMVLSKHENFYLVNEVIEFEAGKIKYGIPSRAISSKLREVYFLENTDDVQNLREMFQIGIDDLSQSNYVSRVNHFYIEDDSIVLHARPESARPPSGLLVWYFQRPNALVLSSRVGVIKTIDRINGIITLETLPDNFSTTETFDFIRTKSPHKILDYDVPIIGINTVGKYITLDPTYIPDTLAIGDRMAIQGETDLVNAPTELHPLLAQMTTTLVLESLGDNQNLVLAEQRLKKMEGNTGSVLDNRVIGSPIKAKRRNSPIRNKVLRRHYRGY